MFNFSRTNPPSRVETPLEMHGLALPVRLPVVGTEKKRFSVNVRQLHSSEGSHHPSQEVETEAKHKQNIEDEDWRPGFWNRFPVLGFCALLTVLLASLGAVILLIVSNNKAQEDWISWLPPNVILAGLNNAANIAIGVAVGQGVAIAWWRRALKGATVKELHHSWAFSTSLSTVLIRFKYFNAVALAALTTKFTIIDGMLFQKASEITTEAKMSYLNLTTLAWQQFPATGTLNSHGNATAAMTTQFTTDFISMQYAADGIFRDQFQGYVECNGLCMTNMTGIGFSVSCNVTSESVDYGKSAITAYNLAANSSAQNASSQQQLAEKYMDIPLFSVDFEQHWPDAEKNYSWIGMKSVSTEPNTTADDNDIVVRGGSCPALRTTRHCELRPALINYPLTIQNYTSDALNITELVLGWDSLTDQWASENYSIDQAQNFTVVETLYVEEQQVAGAMTSLGGFLLALQGSLGGSVLLSYADRRWSTNETGTLAPVVQLSLPRSDQYCDYNYPDPIDSILGQLNTLTFCAMGDDLLAYNDANEQVVPHLISERTTSGEQLKQTTIFRTRWPYLAGALASTVVCIMCVLPAYWGFWELGREVSLGPFEIANALNAPVFDPVRGGAGDVRQLLKIVGGKKMQYGETEDGKKLAFHDGPE